MVQEFKEIEIPGYKIVFRKEGGISINSNSPLPQHWEMVVVNEFGAPVKYYKGPIGLGVIPKLPERTNLLPLPSDTEGFWGKECPFCNKYFRITQKPNEKTNISKFVDNEFNYCPYCGKKTHEKFFFTTNQKEFIKANHDFANTAMRENREIEVDLDKIVAGLRDNFLKFKYNEEIQQTKIVCSNEKCCCVYDVMGNKHTYCPLCGNNNFLEILNIELEEITQSNSSSEDILKNLISKFQPFADRHKEKLCNKLNSNNKRKRVRNINFQNILKARDELIELFNVDIFSDFEENDIKFTNKLFQQRHLYTHKNGIVDEDYINRSGDNTVREGQYLISSPTEIKDLPLLLKKMASILNNMI